MPKSSEERVITCGVLLPLWPTPVAVVLLEGDTKMTVLDIEKITDVAAEDDDDR